MRNIVLLDREQLNKFSGLFLGEITNHYKSNTICYGAVVDGEDDKKIPVALLMADVVNNELIITWMYVASPYRNQYIMTEMVSTMIYNLRNSKLVSSIYCATVDEEIAQYLLAQFGFYYDVFGKKGIMTSQVGDLMDLSAQFKDSNPSKRLIDIDEVIIHKLNKYFAANQEIQVGVPVPIKPEDYMELSMAVVENGEIAAIILLNEDGDDLVVSYAFAKEGYGHLLMHIVVSLYKELSEYPENKKIICAALNDSSTKLFSKLFTSYTIDRLYECELFL